jgi:hypothetical protein
MKQLDRVSDIGVLTKNYLSGQEKIRSGMVSTGLPDDATPDQLADYRTANGIPETAEAYELQLDEGLVLGEEDNRIFKGVFDVAHGLNLPGTAMSALTNALLTGRQVEADAAVAQDGVDNQLTNQQLKEAWGGDFERNNNSVKGLIAKLPESIRQSFMDARLPDGRAVFNSPEIMVAMAEWAMAIDPAATVVPNSANAVQAMNDEIKALEARMGDDDWHADTEANARYETLIDARERLAAKDAA